MRDVLAHRGPDGSGLMIDGPVGLAHTRLAIVDVAGGQQPMSNEDGSVWIVYNGEIYNHAELRPGLQARGHTLPNAGATPKPSCTCTRKRATESSSSCRACSRSRSGTVGAAACCWRATASASSRSTTPSTDTELLFASEIKALLASGLVRAAFNESVLPEFLATRFVAGERRSSAACGSCCRAHVLTWSRATACRRGATGICHRRPTRRRGTNDRRPLRRARSSRRRSRAT